MSAGKNDGPAVRLRNAPEGRQEQHVPSARGRGQVPWIRPCAGRLLNLGEYPGLVPTTRPGSCVHGEVYALAAATTLARLDEYERCAPSDPEPHEFERVKMEALLQSGTRECGLIGSVSLARVWPECVTRSFSLLRLWRISRR